MLGEIQSKESLFLSMVSVARINKGKFKLSAIKKLNENENNWRNK